jgi:hypothetical protein
VKSPSSLPALRTELLTAMHRRDSIMMRIIGMLLADSGIPFSHSDKFAKMLQAAQLYWVTAEMAAVTDHAAQSLPEMSFGPQRAPDQAGFVYFDGGIGAITDLDIDAAMWATGDVATILMFFVRRERWLIHARGKLAELGGPDGRLPALPPLVPLALWAVDKDRTYPGHDLPADSAAPAAARLYTAWRLMQQPTLAETTSTKVGRSRPRGGGRPKPLANVSIVSLRRRYAASPVDGSAVDTSGRRYSHRWVVTGHWREQACGPGWSLRDTTWVVEHEKGPEDAPLVRKTRVKVWRR